MKVKLEDGSVVEVSIDNIEEMTEEEKSAFAGGSESEIFDNQEMAQQLKETKEKLSNLESEISKVNLTVDDIRKEFSKMYFNGEGEKKDETDDSEETVDVSEIIEELKGEF